MNDAEKQIDRLERMDKLLNEGRVTPEEVAQVFEATFAVIKELKKQIENAISENKGVADNQHSVAFNEISNLEARFTEMSQKIAQKSKTDITSLKTQLTKKIKEVKDLIPELPDLSVLEDRIDEVERKIPKIPPPVDIDGEEIVEKINDLPTDDDDKKIDAKHIKNLPKNNGGGGGGGGSGVVREVVAGRNISVDSSSPQYPIVTNTNPKITVSSIAPVNPLVNDLWVQII